MAPAAFTIDSDKQDPTLTEFESLTKELIRPLVELNDHINNLTSKENKINSTRIVVTGDQSHGKTSLLEALSGIDLPRGEGIQTRVPLILQLRAAASGNEYATIRLESSSSEDEAERISFCDIGSKVREYTQKAAGDGKDIRDEPIELKIYRIDQDDLTLVDLPGITRVALNDQAGGDGRKLEKMILDMCKKYMAPEQSILLNVVSAMVDFSTSASLQLSRELDPTGDRTMICVTKVDQHKEDGLSDKIHSAIDMMKLDPEHVFAVRNRSQQENNDQVPLKEVRDLEKRILHKICQDCDVGYGLGVGSLSKQLVKIQYEQIVHTLPRTRAAIREQIEELESSMDKLGEPVGDARACRSKVMHCIESSISELQDEVLGRTSSAPVSDGITGASFEFELTIEDLEAERKKSLTHSYIKSIQDVCGFKFTLMIDPNRKKKAEDANGSVGAYLSVEFPEDNIVASMALSYEFTVSSGEKYFSRKLEEEFVESHKGRGSHEFISAADADNIKGSTTFQVNVFVEKLVLKKYENNTDDYQSIMLCAQLNKLQDDFVSSLDKLYSHHYFFSSNFCKKLQHEVSACRGGTGLPGAVGPHVPVNILKTLRQKLPIVVTVYRDGVQKAVLQKVDKLVDRHFESKLYPKLNVLIIDSCKSLVTQQASILVKQHGLILEWEESVCSSNHYFMDTVQSIRSIIADTENDRPSYLKHLSEASIKLMSNEDQRIVDMQIEIFAYWKLMKKRVADYMIMSTHSVMVHKPINIMLKPALLEATMSHGDTEIVRLLSPDSTIVRRRNDISRRLDRLLKARSSLEEWDEKAQLL
jgi:interferon-induced GTP-binding protein Mx1